MNALQLSRKLNRWIAAGLSCFALSVAMNAQVQTETTINHEPATTTVKVDRGEVVYVSGHDLVVKSDKGKIVHFANVPDSAKATVDGKQLGIHDLEPGMKLERTITTTTTPRTITTVQSVTGKVWHVTPPDSVILTLEDGTNQRFTIPNGQKIMVNGELKDAWGLKKGMKVSATRVVEAPETAISQETEVTGTAPTSVAIAPPADQPMLFAMFIPVRPTLASATPAELPKTGSSLPLLGLLGALAIGSSAALRLSRTNA
jgi:LPXTG-motif cell wall-anchored protein